MRLTGIITSTNWHCDHRLRTNFDDLDTGPYTLLWLQWVEGHHGVMDSLILVLGLTTYWGGLSFNGEDCTLLTCPWVWSQSHHPLFIHRAPIGHPSMSWTSHTPPQSGPSSLEPLLLPALLAFLPPPSYLPVSSGVCVSPEWDPPSSFQPRALPFPTCTLKFFFLYYFFPWDLTNLSVYYHLIPIQLWWELHGGRGLLTCSHWSFNFQSLDSVWHTLGVLLMFLE